MIMSIFVIFYSQRKNLTYIQSDDDSPCGSILIDCASVLRCGPSSVTREYLRAIEKEI